MLLVTFKNVKNTHDVFYMFIVMLHMKLRFIKWCADGSGAKCHVEESSTWKPKARFGNQKLDLETRWNQKFDLETRKARFGKLGKLVLETKKALFRNQRFKNNKARFGNQESSFWQPRARFGNHFGNQKLVLENQKLFLKLESLFWKPQAFM